MTVFVECDEIFTRNTSTLHVTSNLRAQKLTLLNAAHSCNYTQLYILIKRSSLQALNCKVLLCIFRKLRCPCA